jgi:hypothetical protein
MVYPGFRAPTMGSRANRSKASGQEELMQFNSPAVHRLCLAVDVEGYSKRLMPDQYDLQNRLLFTMSQGCLAAGVKPGRCDRQNSGDGQILVFPPGIDEKTVMPRLILGLLTALHRVNEPTGPCGRVRLRISLGEGAVQTAPNGFVSKAVESVCRVLDSDQLRKTLAGRPSAEAAVAVSDGLYQDKVAQGWGGLPAADFQRALVSVPKKNFSTYAWIHAPDGALWLSAVPGYPDTSELKRRQRTRAAALGVGGAATLAWAYFVSHGQHSGAALADADDSGQDLGEPSDGSSTGYGPSYDGPYPDELYQSNQQWDFGPDGVAVSSLFDVEDDGGSYDGDAPSSADDADDDDRAEGQDDGY